MCVCVCVCVCVRVCVYTIGVEQQVNNFEQVHDGTGNRNGPVTSLVVVTWAPPPPVNKQTDRHDWKNYLPSNYERSGLWGAHRTARCRSIICELEFDINQSALRATWVGTVWCCIELWVLSFICSNTKLFVHLKKKCVSFDFDDSKEGFVYPFNEWGLIGSMSRNW